MFSNIGGKIQGLAVFIFVIEAACAIGAGIAVLINFGWWGLFIAFGGTLFAWISSWGLYGFGVLIENSDAIALNTAITNKRLMKLEDAVKKINRETPKTNTIKFENFAQRGTDYKEESPRKVPIRDQIKITNADDIIYQKCPNCHEEVFYYKGLEDTKCPWCGWVIKNEQYKPE